MLEQEGLRTTTIKIIGGKPHVAVHETASGELLRTHPAAQREIDKYGQAQQVAFEGEVEEGLPPRHEQFKISG